jgi:hypothetical protein
MDPSRDCNEEFAAARSSRLSQWEFMERDVEPRLVRTARQLSRSLASGTPLTQCSHEATLQGFSVLEASNVTIDRSLPFCAAVVTGRLRLRYTASSVGCEPPLTATLEKTLLAGSSVLLAAGVDVMLSGSSRTVLICLPQRGAAIVNSEDPDSGADENLSNNPDLADHTTLSDEELLSRIDAADFDDMWHLQQEGGAILQELVRRGPLLRQLLAAGKNNEALRSMAEHQPAMDKYVVFQSARKKARVRIHRFRPDFLDKPHSHRWSLCSRIIKGTTLTRYFGADFNLRQDYKEHAPSVLVAIRLTEGSYYSFGHTIIHTFQGSPGCVTLTLRGPVSKPVATAFGDGKLEMRHGAATKVGPLDTMTSEQYDNGLKLLNLLDII